MGNRLSTHFSVVQWNGARSYFNQAAVYQFKLLTIGRFDRSFQPRTRLPFQRHWGQRAGMFLLPVRQLYHQTVVTQAIVVSPLKNLVGAALPSHGRPSFDNRE